MSGTLSVEAEIAWLMPCVTLRVSGGKSSSLTHASCLCKKPQEMGEARSHGQANGRIVTASQLILLCRPAGPPIGSLQIALDIICSK